MGTIIAIIPQDDSFFENLGYIMSNISYICWRSKMKLIKKILLGLLIGALVLTALIAISIPADGMLGRQRIDSVTNVTVPGINGEPDVKAYVAKPDGTGPFPTVIMIHEFFGLNESIVGKAEGLAQEGYYVIAPDTFRGSTTSWIPRAIYQVITNKSEQVNVDLDSVYAWLESQPEVDAERIGIVGFCYGGRTSLLYSLHNNSIAATAVFYGSPETDPNVLKSLPGPVLGIFGGADMTIPEAEVKAFMRGLNDAGIPNDITIYDGQPHAFVTDIQSIRAGGVQAEAWNQMLQFLEKNLKNADSSRQGTATEYEPDFPWQYYVLLVYEHAFGSASHMH
jgi:carboxymethylenebutenolidase